VSEEADDDEVDEDPNCSKRARRCLALEKS